MSNSIFRRRKNTIPAGVSILVEVAKRRPDGTPTGAWHELVFSELVFRRRAGRAVITVAYEISRAETQWVRDTRLWVAIYFRLVLAESNPTTRDWHVLGGDVARS